MTGLLVAIGVPVAAFAALVAGTWRHRGRNIGRHVAPTGTLSRDVHDYTVPIAHTEHGPPWDDAPEPDPAWVADLRAALDEVQPSGWVKPELHHILAAPTLADSCSLCYGSGWIPGIADPVGPLDELPCPECHVALADSAEPCALCGQDTADHCSTAMTADVAVQDADATRYGEDLAGWCAGQLRALRETLCER